MNPLPASPLTGIVFLTVALSLNSVKDGLAKMLDGYYPPTYLLCVQLIVASMILIPVIVRKYGLKSLRPAPLPQQIFRAVFFVGGVGLFYWALNFIPLADATSMVFVAPLVVTAVSPLFLGEKIGLHRITAVIVGFIGVIVMLRPDLGGDRLGYFIALGAGSTLGFFYMMNRKLAAGQPQLVAVAHASLIGALLLLPTMPFVWVPFQAEHGLIFAGFLVIALSGQVLLISAFSYTPASTLAPFQYSQLIAATLFGVIVFDNFPDGVTWAGILLVIAAGLYVAYRGGAIIEMSFSYINAVVFDLDGTLIDSAPDLLDGIDATLREFGISAAPREEILPAIAIGSDNMLMSAFEIAGIGDQEDLFNEAFAWFLDFYAENSLVKTDLFPGVRESLDALRAAGIKLAICTNKRMSLTRPIVEGLRLEDYFPVVTGRDSYAERKPHPMPLLETLKQLGASPDEAVMIGDTITDIKVAKAAGTASIGLTFGYARLADIVDAGALVDDMRDILPLILR